MKTDTGHSSDSQEVKLKGSQDPGFLFWPGGEGEWANAVGTERGLEQRGEDLD